MNNTPKNNTMFEALFAIIVGFVVYKVLYKDFKGEKNKVVEDLNEMSDRIESLFRKYSFQQEEMQAEIASLKDENVFLKKQIEKDNKMKSALRDYFGMMLFSNGQIAYSQGRNLMDVFDIKPSEYCDVEQFKQWIEDGYLERITCGRGDYYQHQPNFIKVDADGTGYIKNLSKNEPSIDTTIKSILPWMTISSGVIRDTQRRSFQENAYLNSKKDWTPEQRYEFEYGSSYKDRYQGIINRVMDTLKVNLI